MKRKPRICYSESQKALMWERWKKGESLQQIASSKPDIPAVISPTREQPIWDDCSAQMETVVN